MKKWFAVDILVDADATEAVESALNMLDALGTEVAFFREGEHLPQSVSGFFNVLPDENEIRSAIDDSLQIYGFGSEAIKSTTTRIVEEADWLAEWKKHWRPTVVGPFVIAPPWEAVDEDKIVIRIEPNMAFGTGTHETTQLCLKSIADNSRVGQTFLDVGTGTGILAIAAAKLGSDNILAFETDADSVAIAKENAILNGVGEKIEFVHGTLGDEIPQFDLVCANLTIDVIVPLLPLLLAKACATLVLSGILVEQKNIIPAELEKFEISNFRIKTLGEWLAVIISME